MPNIKSIPATDENGLAKMPFNKFQNCLPNLLMAYAQGYKDGTIAQQALDLQKPQLRGPTLADVLDALPYTDDHDLSRLTKQVFAALFAQYPQQESEAVKAKQGPSLEKVLDIINHFGHDRVILIARLNGLYGAGKAVEKV